jgi:hypothetical protein
MSKNHIQKLFAPRGISRSSPQSVVKLVGSGDWVSFAPPSTLRTKRAFEPSGSL